jgi:hypothetical protein
VSKAHLPSVVGISVTNADANRTQSALDMARGVYTRRLHLAGGAIVEQRTFAHRARKHLLVTEFETLGGSSGEPAAAAAPAAAVTLELASLFDPLCSSGPPPPPPPAPPAPAFNGQYLKISGDSGGNGHDVGSVQGCQSGQCPVAKIKAACDANPHCELFQTHGFLKECLGGPPGATQG